MENVQKLKREFTFCLFSDWCRFFWFFFFFQSTQVRIWFPRKLTMGHLKAGTCLQTSGRSLGLRLFWLGQNECSELYGHVLWDWALCFLPVPNIIYSCPRLQVVVVAPPQGWQVWEWSSVQKGGNKIVFCSVSWLTFCINLLIWWI